jgi:uncharacterized membrane protein
MNRLFQHIFTTRYRLKKYLPNQDLEMLELVINNSETRHTGKIRFIFEASLPVGKIKSNFSSFDRALEIFTEEKIWDTEENNGVLFYFLFAENKMEIILDRGIKSFISETLILQIIYRIEENFKLKRYSKGIVNGISEVSRILEFNFPPKIRDIGKVPEFPFVT